MLILHFSITATAGAPIRLVQAINRHTQHSARLVVLESMAGFSQDLVFHQNQDEIIELSRRADIIHLHNYVDVRSNSFAPIDFMELQKNGVKIIRQFHSSPQTISRYTGHSEESIIQDSTPQLVIAQFHERYYPDAMLVPNIIPLNEPEYKPLPSTSSSTFDFSFGYTSLNNAWHSRWDTKGAPETHQILSGLSRRNGFSYQRIANASLREALRFKQQSRIILDEMITGSYHLSGLEGLSLGRPVLAFLDGRTEYIIREISGADSSPFINVRLEDLGEVLSGMLKNHELCDEIGRLGRCWMENFWSDVEMVGRYAKIYEMLCDNPDRICRQEHLRLDYTPATLFFAQGLPDLIHAARERKQNSLLSRLHGFRHAFSFKLDRFYHRLRRAKNT